MQNKVYLAGRYSRREELWDYAQLLESMGYEVTSRWLHGEEDGKTKEEIAIMDYFDCIAADIILSFTESPDVKHAQGARHAEFMLGYERGKRCVLIGPREIIFHHMPNIEQYNTIYEFVAYESP